MQTLIAVMDNYCKSIKYDKALLDKITRFYYKLFTKNEDSLSFFGEGLWGVYPIYFTNDDNKYWFDEVLDVDDVGLIRAIHSLDSIETSWKRASDCINLSIIYSIYRILNLSISPHEKHRYAKLLLHILHYKFLSSLQAHRFKYPVDKSIAVAVYENLSKKYLIKVCGTWMSVLEHRANSILSNQSIEYKTLIKYKDDKAVIYIIQEIQNRIRKMVNGLSEQFYKVKERDNKIGVQSKIFSDESGDQIIDSVSSFTTYVRYAHSIIGDKDSFIKPEIMQIAQSSSNRLPIDALEKTLYWLSINSYGRMSKSILLWIENIILFSFKIIAKNQLKTNQLMAIVIKLRAMLLSSRVTESVVLDVKATGDTLINESKAISSKSAESNLRTTCIIYIVLRTLTMKYYT